MVANVLLDQVGVPVPAIPTLIFCGALALDHPAWGMELLLGCVAASLAADVGWYWAGRVYGNRVMKLLCRVSLTPDSCVSDAQSRFERSGATALIAAKFLPGLSIIAPPLAGAMRMRPLRFVSLSGAGALLWVGAYLLLGALFKPQIERLLPHLATLGGRAVPVIAVVLAAYISFKWYERRRFYSKLRMARISVNELYDLMEAQRAPLVLDVRSSTARQLEPRWIPGARHVPVEQVSAHLEDLPRDREIVVYCSCPNEASAAKVAKLLMKHGFRQIRPLHGGLEAWIEAGHAVER